jgi:hypothetical protein
MMTRPCFERPGHLLRSLGAVAFAHLAGFLLDVFDPLLDHLGTVAVATLVRVLVVDGAPDRRLSRSIRLFVLRYRRVFVWQINLLLATAADDVGYMPASMNCGIQAFNASHARR